MSDRNILIIFAAVCLAIFLGEALSMLPNTNQYDSDFRTSAEGFEYSFSTNASAEFNLVLLDSGVAKPLSRLYLFDDPDYGWVPGYMPPGEYLDLLGKRLDQRGFHNWVHANLEDLSNVLQSSEPDVGILFCTGAIPEEIISDKLLDWVRSGGSLVWTYDVLGRYASRADGTIYALEHSLETEYLSACCTTQTVDYAYALDNGEDITRALSLGNNLLYGALDCSKLTTSYRQYGFNSGARSMMTVLECGAGRITVVAGTTDDLQIADVSQMICSGLDLDAVLIHACSRAVSSGTVGGMIGHPLESGHHYTAYTYLTGVNPGYGRTTVVSI